MTDKCRDCMHAEFVLRRIGFRDTVSWGAYDGPNRTLHGFHSNTGSSYNGHSVSGKLSMCSSYRSELAWLAAGRPARVSVYLAHPVAGEPETNIVNAVLWLKYLRRQSAQLLSSLTNSVISARPNIQSPWLAAIEDDRSPGYDRELALQDCRDTVLLFDEVWLVGGRISPGMRIEAECARQVRDLTHLGKLPPLRS